MGKGKAQRHKGTKTQSDFYGFFSVFILFIINCSLFIAVSAASAADVDGVVDRMQKKFAGIIDIKGTFVQKSYIKDIEQTQEYSGTFFIKKPSRMMWEYAAPRDEKVIINNLDTWIYKKSQNQVIRTKFSKEAYSQVPIALLGSLENISADFDITMPEENALQLVPKQRVGFIKTIVLEITPGEMPVKMFTIFDTYGNIIMIKLRDVKINPGLDDSLFIFKTPPGAEVFDLGQ
ncbi:MAG TPA: outer membrane lipoprotein carrier protein LolA [Nitrospirae bacterium]|nr:outer-membrane lipoprotein carrier protein precursor [bacterium BMS3Abin06]GBD98017.1 outer-membrane lipoprotein carrier protein precursor [bacterium BMS3Abin07]HDH13427.1 outer membrane lipoprotein carrier protein LolA [Nitrospirota bacterium]HDZ02158.1 outer membrane lipoprotein carrier protein LolA [Nitrospirota bacterium]